MSVWRDVTGVHKPQSTVRKARHAEGLAPLTLFMPRQVVINLVVQRSVHTASPPSHQSPRHNVHRNGKFSPRPAVKSSTTTLTRPFNSLLRDKYSPNSASVESCISGLQIMNVHTTSEGSPCRAQKEPVLGSTTRNDMKHTGHCMWLSILMLEFIARHVGVRRQK